jgi:hypothetical protein
MREGFPVRVAPAIKGELSPMFVYVVEVTSQYNHNM